MHLVVDLLGLDACASGAGARPSCHLSFVGQVAPGEVDERIEEQHRRVLVPVAVPPPGGRWCRDARSPTLASVNPTILLSTAHEVCGARLNVSLSQESCERCTRCSRAPSRRASASRSSMNLATLSRAGTRASPSSALASSCSSSPGCSSLAMPGAPGALAVLAGRAVSSRSPLCFSVVPSM